MIAAYTRCTFFDMNSTNALVLGTNLGDGNTILPSCSCLHPAVTFSGDRSRDSCKRCHRRKKSRNNDGSNDEAKEPTKDVEKNGSIKCHSQTENDSAMKDTLELENESCHL